MNPAKEGFRMPELNEKLLEPLEKMKGIQKMEFGYFKHLSTLSTCSIMILIAFLEKVFSCPQGEGWAIVSIICFALCVIGSLLALQSSNNLVLCPLGIRMILVSGRAEEKKAKKKMEDGFKKINKSFNLLSIYDKVTIGLFIAGLIAFLIFCRY